MKTILITGASDGLGRALAEALAESGHRLLLHGRNPERLKSVAEATGGEVFRADLSSLAATKRLAAAIAAGHDRLDVLVNNAGVGFRKASTERQTSIDGYELRLAVNYLAPVLLTRELLPLLKKAAPSRIVNVASMGQQMFDFEDPQFERGFSQLDAYCRSKLALVTHTVGLAEELAGTGVTVNSLHPATFMATAMTHASGVDVKEPVEKGVAATSRLVSDPELATVTGRFYNGETETPPPHSEALAPPYRRRLADLTDELLKLASV
ncbi:SDR family NAD(P)-dependent oxidoreductase [Streptomyces asiaticus]